MSLHKGQATKVLIMEAATELIFREGLYNVTYKEIAEACGLSHPAIYRHFATMDELLLQTCLHWDQEVEKFVQIHESQLERAKVQLDNFVEKNLRYTSLNREKDALLLGLYYNSLHSEKLKQAYLEMKERALKRIEIILTRGNFENSWKVKSPANKAKALHSQMVGETIHLILNPHDEKIEKRIQRVSRQINLLIAAG